MRQSKLYGLGLYVMAGLYVAAGINHFLNAAMYQSIMPQFIPYHALCVTVSGAAEILLGILLIPFRTRRIAAIGIIILLIAIFPANIQMMLNYMHEDKPGLWLTILRLPLQFVLIWWAYKCTRIIKKQPA